MSDKYTRIRICDTCGKSEQVRKDNKSTTCKNCSLKPKVRPCEYCGILFPVSKRTKYCSDKCKEENSYKFIILKCEVCDKEYETHAYRAETSKYCGKECWSRRGHRTCKHCGKEFGTVGHYGKIYCSRSCSDADMVGEKAARWKDGKSLERERARLSGKLTRWKKAVKDRDGNKCTKCGSGHYLHAHHIKSFSEFPELAAELSNGITLCELCHSVAHGRWIGPKCRKYRWDEL